MFYHNPLYTRYTTRGFVFHCSVVNFSEESHWMSHFEIHPAQAEVISPEVWCLIGMFWGSKCRTSGGGPGCLGLDNSMMLFVSLKKVSRGKTPTNHSLRSSLHIGPWLQVFTASKPELKIEQIEGWMTLFVAGTPVLLDLQLPPVTWDPMILGFFVNLENTISCSGCGWS